tara:strand:+ start:184 stop:1728 length:1545 start_codon:yes stop_codon:yes gene_type:complete
MDANLKMLHFIAMGIILVKTVFIFAGYTGDTAIDTTEGTCKVKDGQENTNVDTTTKAVATGGTNHPIKKGSEYCPSLGKEDCMASSSVCQFSTTAESDPGIMSRLSSIIVDSENSLTKWGKVFISLVAICLMVWNVNVSNSNWLFSVVLFGYIVISYGGLQKTYSEKVGKYGTTTDPDASRQRGCNFVIPKNSYYSAKFLELRIGYIFLIMIASVVICYRNIKGGCWGKDTFNTVMSIFSPLLMIFGLLIVSSMVTPNTAPTGEGENKGSAGGGAAMDYILAFFRGAPVVEAGAAGSVANSSCYRDDWTKVLAGPNVARTGRQDVTSPAQLLNTAAPTANAPEEFLTNKDRLSRVKQRIYMKFVIVVALFAFLIYSSVKSEIKCGLDFSSAKAILTKSPTYLIAIIIFSPFIVKNIIINETVIDYANHAYHEGEGKGQGADKINVSTGASPPSALQAFSLECLIDKMGGLEIYMLLCLLCILMYAGEGTGYKLNMVAACVVASIATGYAMDGSP